MTVDGTNISAKISHIVDLIKLNKIINFFDAEIEYNNSLLFILAKI